MKYILITDFENHWDSLEENFTSFPTRMLGRDLMKRHLVNGTETIFIKKTKKSGKIEKCWTGRVQDIQFFGGKVFFRVEIQAEAICPDAYGSYPNGWFCETDPTPVVT